MTSAHCGSLYTSYTNNGAPYGWVSWNGFDNAQHSIDAAAIRPEIMQGIFYVGPVSSNGGVYTQFYYTGTQSGVTGLRMSGSFSGETFNSPGQVYAVNSTQFYANRAVQHLNIYKCTSQTGDSGSPVFKVDGGGNIIAAGLHVGKLASGDCLYQPVYSIIDQFGGLPCCSN